MLRKNGKVMSCMMKFMNDDFVLLYLRDPQGALEGSSSMGYYSHMHLG